MLDSDTAFFSKILPELCQGLGRRRHAALANVLVQLVGGWRDAVPEEQDNTDLPVKLLGICDLLSEQRDVGLDLCFGVHFSAPRAVGESKS